MTFLWILISPIFYWLSEFSPRSHFEYAMTTCWLPSCSQQSGGSRRRFKTWRRTEAWRINIGDRQFLNFFIWMGGDYLTLSFAEKSRVLYWSIKRKITHNCSNVFNVQWKFKYFFRPRFPPSTAFFRNLPRQLTPSNYFITSKFSRAVYFFKFFVISNVGMICN